MPITTVPITTLSLTRATIVWRRGHATRIAGYGVLSAVAYDGTKGILPVSPLPPIRFRRKPRRGCDLFAPSPTEVGDDGLLIATFPQIPPALGWAVTLTLTDNEDQAKRVVAATLAAAEAAVALIPGMSILGGVVKVADASTNVASAILSARTVGT